MGLHHRKLHPADSDCETYCHEEKSCLPSNCDECLREYCNGPPPSPPGGHSNHKISTYLIISFSIVAAAFLVLCCYAIYVKFFSRRNRSRRRALSRQQTEEDDFVVDEEHGPMTMVDHPIWYIRTTGLQQSIISAITVCKYKKGEGLIEGTECPVCLGEFEEDESLRLLPKCNHAFHLPCIDTWLRSHTNCPMCRAPIVTHPSRIPSSIMEPNVLGSSSVVENSGETETSGGMEDGVAQLMNRGEEEEGEGIEDDGRRVCEAESSASEMVNMQPRRSVSLDSSSAARINLALSTVLPVESHGNSNRHRVGEVNEQIVSKRVDGNRNSKGSSSSRSRYLQGAPSSMKRSRSFNGKHLLSGYSRNQKKPNAPLRSF